MGFPYFDGDKWIDITREERLFCCHLYWKIKDDVKDFVRWLQEKTSLGLNPACEWEAGYEVCFYRDYLYRFGEDLKEECRAPSFLESVPLKRTFDICLFGQDEIVVIEAKAQQGLTNKQLDDFRKEAERIRGFLGMFRKNSGAYFDVKLIGLWSSQYRPKPATTEVFDAILTWKDIDAKYNEPVFRKADGIYKE